jgi:Uncharacterized conserved protein
MTIKKVNENNTKAQILAAYKEAVEQLKQFQAKVSSPELEIKQKINENISNKANQISNQDVLGAISILQKNISSTLSNISKDLIEEIEKFENLKKAVELKEVELKELFDIEKQAFTLTALINAQNVEKEKFEAEQKKTLEEVNARMIEVENNIKKLEEEYQERRKELLLKDEKERTRKQEEFEYEFNRIKQRKLDLLNDEIASKKKEMNEIEEQLLAREKQVSEVEKTIESLKAQIDSFPEREAQIIKETEERVRKEEARTAAIKENYATKDINNKISVYENKIQLLEQILQDEKARNLELTKKLDEAYAKIQDMAVKSVESTNSSKAFDKLQSALSEKNQK